MEKKTETTEYTQRASPCDSVCSFWGVSKCVLHLFLFPVKFLSQCVSSWRHEINPIHSSILTCDTAAGSGKSAGRHSLGLSLGLQSQ
jgi:hypothetical protein